MQELKLFYETRMKTGTSNIILLQSIVFTLNAVMYSDICFLYVKCVKLNYSPSKLKYNNIDQLVYSLGNNKICL